MAGATEDGTSAVVEVEPDDHEWPAEAVDHRLERDPGFERLFTDERVAMVRLAWLLTGSEPQAEEIVQDAFAKVFERWSKLDNPGGYLRTCVVNGCRRAGRRRLVERRHAPPVGRSAAPDDAHGDSELLDALRTLDPKRRAAVVLRYWGDCSQAEVAEAMGVRLGTAKSMLSRAMTDLRKVVEP